jgi:raffinose/stachyose/melibiose transport system permease protein
MTIALAAPRRRRTFQFTSIGRHALLLICGLAWLYPFIWALGSSLKSRDGFFSEGLNPIPKEAVWSNYRDAWQEASFSRYFLNTLVIAVGTVIVTVLLTATAGHALGRFRFPGRGLMLGLISVTLFLPHGYTIIPIFDLIQRLHLLDTLAAVVIVQSASGIVFATFLYMGYFRSMDRELEDAAKIDGAGFHQIFWRVMLPLAGPMTATVALFTFISAWNSFFIPLVFTLGDERLHPLSVGMYAFIGQNSTEWTLLCAGSMLSIVPIVVLFLVLQRFFVNGLAGAIKF